MKVTAFLGSPREQGNSELLLKEAILGIETFRLEVQTFNLNEMQIKPCQNCGGCDETGMCIIEDDMADIYNAIRSADRIILASPVFFFALSAQTKIMIDRCQSFWCEKYLLKKPIPEGPYGRKGLLLIVGGMKKEIGIQCCEASAKAFFRTVNVPEHNVLSFLGVDAKGAILKHPTALTEVFEAGKQLVSPQG
ncbi:MAG: flavodoxin family protein [Nitrospiraceae bacterium]|nr:MAG: flavodoxin family protein [Nitrospiraceae bacterium]